MRAQFLSVTSGEITQINQEDAAILHIVNAVGCKNFGLSASIAEKYPYADIYGSRRPLYTLNRARVSSRDEVGTIRIFKKSECPFIICCVAHYAPGNPTDSDEIKKQSLNTSTDKNYAAGLAQDTLCDRIQHLKKCVEEVIKMLPYLPVTKLCVPAGTGCGLFGRVWEENYLPCIKILAYHKNVEIIEKKRITSTATGSKLLEWTPLLTQQQQQQQLPPVVDLDAETTLTYHFMSSEQQQQPQYHYPTQQDIGFPPVIPDHQQQLLPQQVQDISFPVISEQDASRVLSSIPTEGKAEKARPKKDPRKRPREEEDGQGSTEKKKCNI